MAKAQMTDMEKERAAAQRAARVGDQLLAELRAAKLRGSSGEISPDGVRKLEEIAYLSAVDALKSEHAGSERRSALRVAGLGATTELTKAGFQALIVINGGAIAAILAFIGSLRGGENGALAATIMKESASGLQYFAGGLVLSVLGIGLAFGAQIAIQEGYDTVLKFCRWVSLGTGVLSLGFFLQGTYFVAVALGASGS